MNTSHTAQPVSMLRTGNQGAVKAPRPMAGFTMVELIITMLIAAILATIALPSYTDLMANQRVKSVATDLVIAMTKARSEAIMRNANVTLAAKAGGWENGWTVYPSATPANILENHGAAPPTVAINAATTAGGGTIIYQTSGRLDPAQTGTASFEITSTKSITAYRCVTTDLTGRPNTKATTPCP